MAKARLLQAVCTVAMLAAAPAFAQTNMQPADPGSDQSTSATSHSTHRSAGHAGATRGGRDSSQNAAVDRLNDQSFQAAQQGQPFSAPGGGSMGSGSK
jgi:hypothetical protein